MKRNINLCFLLVMSLLGFAFTANARSYSFQWDIPNSIEIRKANFTGELLPIPDDVTSYVHTTSGNDRMYFFAKKGYVLNKVTNKRSGQSWSINISPNYGPYISVFMSGSIASEGDVFEISCAPLERNKSFTLNVIGDPSLFKAQFTDQGYDLTGLHSGENTVMFSPDFDKTLYIVSTQGRDLDITYNGTTVAKTSGSYTISGVAEGSTVTINAGELEKATLALDCGTTPIADWLYSLRNWSDNTLYEPADITDNKIEAAVGNNIQVNFSEDYVVTGLKLGDKDIFSSYDATNHNVKFTLEASTTLTITGKAKEWGTSNIPFVIMNPQGVNIRCSDYVSGPLADLSEGTAVAEDKALGKYTLVAADSKAFTVKVSNKKAEAYISPKEGWFIQTVYGTADRQFGTIENATPQSGTVYVIALPYTTDKKVLFDVKSAGTATVKVKTESALTQMWDNPMPEYSVENGKNILTFCSGLIEGFKINIWATSEAQESKFAVYQDGSAVAKDDNGVYLIKPYIQKSADDELMSTVLIYADGTNAETSTIVLDGNATLYAGSLRTTLASQGKVITGTTVTVKPADASDIVTVDGVKVALTNGEYTFTTSAATHTISVKADKGVDIVAASPASDTTLKSISTIKITLPALADDYMLYPVENALEGITLTSTAGVTVNPTFGEPGMDDQNRAVFALEFGTITEPGEYTLFIPAASFKAAAWDPDFESYVIDENGASNNEFTAKYIIDSSVKTAMDYFTIEPFDGAKLKSLSGVKIVFDEINDLNANVADGATATFTNGTKTIEASITPQFSMPSSFTVTPSVEGEDVELTGADYAGEWTLTISAGAMTTVGDYSPAITTKFTIGDEYPVYALRPAPGKVSDLSKIYISFPGATEVESVDNLMSGIQIKSGDKVVATAQELRRNDDNNNEFIITFMGITADGDYTLSIPAGAFLLDGDESVACEASYTYVCPWTLTPAAGEVDSLDEFEISFTEAKEVVLDEENRFGVSLSNGNTYACINFAISKKEGAKNTYVIKRSLDSQNPPVGTQLTFIIDEGLFTVDGVPSPMISRKYVLKNNVSGIETKFDPTNGVIGIEPYGVMASVVYDEALVVSVADESKITIKLNGTALQFDETGAAGYMAMTENCYYMFQVANSSSQPLNDGDKLEIILEEGALDLSGTPSPAASNVWTLKNHVVVEPVITPEADKTHGSLETFEISFPGAETVELNNKNGISLRDMNYTWYTEFTVEIIPAEETAARSASAPKAKITFSPAPSAAGKHVLSISYNTFLINGITPNEHITHNVTLDPTITGVSEIEYFGAEKVDVFSIDGRVVLRGAKADELKALEPGLYIINGRKALIK